MKTRVDLHLHTTASDGTWTNEILLQKLIHHNIKIFSITDHNSIENALKMEIQCQNKELIFILGVELSCSYKQRDYHITAYDFNPSSSDLIQLLETNQRLNEEWFNIIVQHAAKVTKQFCMDDYINYKNDCTRGGCKPINFFLDLGIIQNWEGFFKYVSKSQAKAFMPEAKEVIEIVKKANGYPILAHPSEYHKGIPMSFSELEEWFNLGIMGIECFHPSVKSQQDNDYYRDYCKKRDLMITGGSDCHGEFGQPRFIGKPEISIDMVEIDFSRD